MKNLVTALALCSGTLSAQNANPVGLQAPATVPAGAPFEVTWSGPETKGRLDVVQSDGSPLKGGAYTYASKKKSATLTAPSTPGAYAINFVDGAKALGFAEFRVTPVTASLTAPAAVEINESFAVAFTGPTYKQDTIRIVNADGTPLPGGAYAYPAISKDGSVKLKAPVEPGAYQIIYLMQKKTLARADLRVGGSEAGVKAKPTVQAGGDLDVFWNGPNNNGDYITIAPAGSKARVQGGSYAYTSHSTANAVVLLASEKLGDYEVLYVTGGKVLARQAVQVVEVSASLTAPPEVVGTFVFPVNWTGPGNRQDYIVMHDLTKKEDTRFYAYIDPDVPEVTIQAPPAAGAYELRYMTREGKKLATTPITVTPPPTEPGILRVHRDFAKGFGEGSAVEVILDASGSMLQRQDGKRRIEIAKETLASLVAETIPAGTGFAMRVFGHKESGSCRTDLEIPLQPLDRPAVQATIATIQAMNLAKTPIAASLEKVASDLAGVSGDRIVILLTDGEETCEGDPALAIKSLRAKGIDIRVNIVGYSIDDEALQKTFESWATLGGGHYLNAPNGEELTKAVRQALAIPFEVYRDDELVGRGVSGGVDLELPAGTYRVTCKQAGKDVEKEVKVVGKTRVEISLP